jgi:glycerophosphoryl diester phosphodiesterase
VARLTTTISPGLGSPRRPVVIGHRGAAGYRPEHTLDSYELAARMGADYLEPDLVSTADGVLICRHEPEIGGTTDVASHPGFASRRTTKDVDGRQVTGWFAEDFTLAELTTLRAVERVPGARPENTLFDGLFGVPTLQDLLDLRHRLSAELGRPIGVYIETKNPTYFQRAGLALEQRLLDVLEANDLNHPQAPVVVQSFETANLKWLRSAGLTVPLIQLMEAEGAPYDLVVAGDPRTYADLVTAPGLREIASYAQGIGPHKDQVIGLRADGSLGTPTGLVERAHEAGLAVHPYTFRAENHFLPLGLTRGQDPCSRGHAFTEQQAFFEAGIDGLFTDQTDLTVLARAMCGRANWPAQSPLVPAIPVSPVSSVGSSSVGSSSVGSSSVGSSSVGSSSVGSDSMGSGSGWPRTEPAPLPAPA